MPSGTPATWIDSSSTRVDGRSDRLISPMQSTVTYHLTRRSGSLDYVQKGRIVVDTKG